MLKASVFDTVKTPAAACYRFVSSLMTSSVQYVSSRSYIAVFIVCFVFIVRDLEEVTAVVCAATLTST